VGAVTGAGPATLPVSEVFGVTIQGEGPSAGRVCSFVRLGGCNLTCAGCDTAFTWDASRYDLRAELTPLTAEQILDRLPPAPLVVISGGEPMMYRDYPALHELVATLAIDTDVEFETNGTRTPGEQLLRWDRVRWNVSPKLDGPMSTDPVAKRLVEPALAGYADLARAGRAVWKFVVKTPGDVGQAVALADRYGVPRPSVWVMPEGITPDATLAHARAVVGTALAVGVNLTLRQHVLLWPDIHRGR
jgi:7-carboxy-7-deazaguanine synthase